MSQREAKPAFLDRRAYITGVAGSLTVALVIYLVKPARNTVADAFHEVGKAAAWDTPLWVSAAAVVGTMLIMSGAVWVILSRREPRLSHPQLVRWAGVDWPVRAFFPNGNRLDFHVDGPICPLDKTQLGIIIASDMLPVPLERWSDWKALAPADLQFECLACHQEYDLGNENLSMRDMLETARQHALAIARRNVDKGPVRKGRRTMVQDIEGTRRPTPQ